MPFASFPLWQPRGAGGNIADRAVDLVAGIVILSWPELGIATLAVIIGITLIFRGIMFIAAGWVLRGADPDTPVAISGA